MMLSLSPETTKVPITLTVGPRKWTIVPTAEESPAGFHVADGVYVDGDRLLVTQEAEEEEFGAAIRTMIDIGNAAGAAGGKK